MNFVIILAETAAYHGRWLRERPEDYGPQTLGRLLAGLYLPATRYIEALNLRQKVLADFAAAVFDKSDVLHAPVVPMPVPTIPESDESANPGFMDYVARIGHCRRPLGRTRVVEGKSVTGGVNDGWRHT